MEQSIQCALQVAKPGVFFVKKIRPAWCLFSHVPQQSAEELVYSSGRVVVPIRLSRFYCKPGKMCVQQYMQGHILSAGHVGRSHEVDVGSLRDSKAQIP